LVRSNNGGADGFTRLDVNQRVNPTANIVVPVWSTTLGHERLVGSSLSIAIDPRNADTVYVAYADVNNAGQPQVHVFGYADGGLTRVAVFDAPANTALPALAVNSNGTVGLLYTQLRNGNLETHFDELRFDFSTSKLQQRTDDILSTFPDGTPALVLDGNGKPIGPYIGDYEGLTAVGTKFYGTFSASNTPNPSHFPRGAYYQRYVYLYSTRGTPIMSDFSLQAPGYLNSNGGSYAQVNTSIDPFFCPFRDPTMVMRPDRAGAA
jgi:hypothetical protein